MGWEHVYGPEIERDWHSPFYDSVLEDSIYRINPTAAPAAIDEALLKLRNFENAELKKKNAVFMEYLQNGIEVSYHENGENKSAIIYIADFENAGKPGDKNSYIVANQWTFIENSNKRPDILLFLNGLPVCLFELKSPSREQTDASEADSMGVPAASGGWAIRSFAVCRGSIPTFVAQLLATEQPLRAAATIPNA